LYIDGDAGVLGDVLADEVWAAESNKSKIICAMAGLTLGHRAQAAMRAFAYIQYLQPEPGIPTPTSHDF
jgi:hypothetical protein